jgi:hypothetical protein
VTEGRDSLENEMNLRFPMITIAVSYEDLSEPIHVDLGSVPPFVAASVLEKVLEVMKQLVIGPKITFQGMTLAEPIFEREVGIQDFFDQFEDNEEDQDGDS